MNKLMMYSFIAVALSLAMSCTGTGVTDIPVNDWPWGNEPEQEQPQPEVKEDPNKAYVDAGWTNVGDTYGALPDHINVYKSPQTLQKKAAIAYIAVSNITEGNWDVWSVKSDNLNEVSYKTNDSYKTPSQVYEDTQCPIITNAGYFFYSEGNYTSSLASNEKNFFAFNINYASIDWVTIYYPTRAAFVEKPDGTFDACWTYKTNSGPHYTYQVPAENSYDKDPEPVPTATFPEKASAFEAHTSIGGGPVLINDGIVVNTWEEELFEHGGVNPTSNNPRTAIGITADKKLILFVCEGRNQTEGVAGMTTEEVANVLLDLGCVEAINLDGGGSSCMLVNGKETIKVSDGKQRSVASTVMLM